MYLLNISYRSLGATSLGSKSITSSITIICKSLVTNSEQNHLFLLFILNGIVCESTIPFQSYLLPFTLLMYLVKILWCNGNNVTEGNGI